MLLQSWNTACILDSHCYPAYVAGNANNLTVPTKSYNVIHYKSHTNVKVGLHCTIFPQTSHSLICIIVEGLQGRELLWGHIVSEALHHEQMS